MLEQELVQVVDSAFTNLGYEIMKEVRYTLVRIDREVICGPKKYIIEVEGNAKSFKNGIRQLLTVKEQTRSHTPDALMESSDLVLIMPELSYKMIEDAPKFGIRLFDLTGLRKLEAYKTQTPVLINESYSSLNSFLSTIIEKMKILNNYMVQDNGQILCDIKHPRLPQLIRIRLWSKQYFEIHGYHGIKETHITKRTKKRTKSIPAPEWEAYMKRIPHQAILKESKAFWLPSGIQIGDAFMTEAKVYQDLEKLHYWIFGEIDISELFARIYEVPNPFSIAYNSIF